ncbi:biotin--[acetyl-CoA-carboxylase] ligase [Cellulomonas composti]|uniref:biotin--[biotin carboxyl-carrier protein] ligase n=1 Tax=Cellulomonas composti TaxID=266130 RepID=A0A511JCD9_9CELL|nr:biotin--[acetyl-CoA-carboxylase] ligase [Cellulomonas composti]GEL95642.1 biotin--[acetyl-CoA-carboxylase] ligase [Cellulomonas composti]
MAGQPAGHALHDPREPLDPAQVRALLQQPDGPLPRVEVVARTGSTNRDLVDALRAEPDAWPSGSLLVADHQDAGLGRSGRSWESPPGTSLTCSFVVRPQVGGDLLGWLPLLAGLGAVTAVRATAGVAAVLKWPNDVLAPADTPVDGWTVPGWDGARKVAGVLAELVPLPAGPPAVVVGIGLNVLQQPAELPVPSAGSLVLAGGRHLERVTVLVALVSALDDLTRRWRESGGDVVGSGLADEVAAVVATLGTRVRVDLPDGRALEGRAERLDEHGALVVVDDDERAHTVLAGDVHHLRVLR